MPTTQQSSGKLAATTSYPWLPSDSASLTRAAYPKRANLPIFPPPESLLIHKPSLPSPPRPCTISLGGVEFCVSTHLVPGAYLRSVPQDIPQPALPGPDVTDKRTRRAGFHAALDTLMETRRVADSAQGAGTGFPNVLWACVNRYTRKDAKNKGRCLTLFFTHGIGLHKETWEPTASHLLSLPETRGIEEIWSWEAVHHGDAARINRHKLSAIYDWRDNARDVAVFLSCYLPSLISSAALPLHLDPVHPLETAGRLERGYQERTLVAIGHSYGGCSIALAAQSYPRLFSSLILVDPVIVKPLYYEEHQDPHRESTALIALMRRSSWPNRVAAKQLMAQNPMFQAWDAAVLDAFIEHGLFSERDGRLALKMPGLQEALTYLESIATYEVWEGLKDIDERIPLHWIMPGKPTGPKDFGGPRFHRERVWRRENNSSNVVIKAAGHLLPQEQPEQCAKEICSFLERHYSEITSKLIPHL
ncbi:hypothetical protein HGRIS_012388 [Hohenbuehelia grisea]|uniref:AB hydrolase-1 domain-containing protein n=1 Tax=Hohenbuehelia grisea TaxID=104357 RepID=A0ABR3IS56_9AGAR